MGGHRGPFAALAVLWRRPRLERTDERRLGRVPRWLSPLVVRDGVLVVRRPLAGVTGLRPLAGTVALLCALIGTTSFDGFSSSRAWNDGIVPPLQGAMEAVGL